MSATQARTPRTATPKRIWGALALVLALAAVGLPLIGLDSAQQYLLAYMVIVCLLAVSLHFLMGVAGLFSLGQAAFFGFGAYVGVWLMDMLGLDAALALPLVAAFGAALGLLMATATLRSSDLYMALTTLAFGYIGANVVRNVEYFGGAQGLTSFDLKIWGLPLDDPRAIYWVGLAFLLALIVVIVSMRRSRLGRALMAARESPLAAKSIGVDTSRYRFLAFGISGAASAVAGALYTAYALVLDPSVFDLSLTIAVLTIAIVGGIRSLPGVLFAAVFLTYFRNSAEQFGVAQYVLLVYGALVVLALLFVPRGLGGVVGDLARGLLSRDRSRTADLEKGAA